MLKSSIDEISLSTANEFAVQFVFALAEHYSITLEKVFEVLTELNYWRVINDTEVCCVLAHDGIQATLHDIEDKVDAILSRNDKHLDVRRRYIPFESQSITIIERIMKDKNISRQRALQMWFSSKTYKEIVNRELTYISAMRGYYELNLEFKKSTEWMKKEFE